MNDPTPLQFERAELPQAPHAVACGICKRTPLGQYYSVNGKPTCDSCTEGLTQYMERKPTAAAWTQAIGLGAGAALAAAGVYALSIAVTGYNLSIVSIAVGWLVGRAVRKGAAGGRSQQVLAVAMTYLSVSLALIARLVWEVRSHLPSPAVVLPLLATAPFRMVSFPIGTLIVGFGLYEAWRVTRRPVIQVTGPHPVAAAPGAHAQPV